MNLNARTWKYILKEDKSKPIRCENLSEWGEFMGDLEKRRVANTTVRGCRVSTVFLGLDYGTGNGEPILWETMVFPFSPEVDEMRRYTSYEDAIKGHKEIVEGL